MITSARNYWRQDPSKLPTPTNGKRPSLRRMPLFDLALLQEDIAKGVLSVDHVQIVTERARRDRRDRLPWRAEDLLHFVGCLKPFQVGAESDFHAAEWCQDSYGNWYACDAYVMRYDDVARRRSAQGLEVYLKFSVLQGDGVAFLVLSLHPSR